MTLLKPYLTLFLENSNSTSNYSLNSDECRTFPPRLISQRLIRSSSSNHSGQIAPRKVFNFTIIRTNRSSFCQFTLGYKTTEVSLCYHQQFESNDKTKATKTTNCPSKGSSLRNKMPSN